MRRKARRRSYRRNAVTRDDVLYMGVAAVAAFSIGMIIGRKRAGQEAAVAGLGAYYQNQMNLPISGLGHYVRVR